MKYIIVHRKYFWQYVIIYSIMPIKLLLLLLLLVLSSSSSSSSNTLVVVVVVVVVVIVVVRKCKGSILPQFLTSCRPKYDKLIK